MKAFHAYDIRGVYERDFTLDDIYKTGYFLAQYFGAKDILVGRDIRKSSDAVFDALSRGITDYGTNVHDLGLSTTPMVYYMSAKHGYSLSVMITASHNDKEYNGLKVSRENAMPVGYDNGLNEIEKLVLSGIVEPKETKGQIVKHEKHEEYLDFQKQYIEDLSKLNMAIDCSNGMAALFIKKLLGDKPIYINEELDGNFPAHSPNPLVEKNRKQLKDTVLSNKCDVGVIFDGDADRVMFLDEKGEFIAPDLLIAALGHYFLEQKGRKGKVIQDIRTSKAVGEYLMPMGAEMETWRVGRAYAAIKLREIDGIFGGEFAGHYYFKDFYYSDSGILASLILLGLFAKFKEKGVSVSALVSKIKKYENSGEINFTLHKKLDAMEAVCQHFKKNETLKALYDFDGYRLEFPDWWFNIRPSNTEPYLRLLVEANSQELLEKKVDEISTIIKGFE